MCSVSRDIFFVFFKLVRVEGGISLIGGLMSKDIRMCVRSCPVVVDGRGVVGVVLPFFAIGKTEVHTSRAFRRGGRLSSEKTSQISIARAKPVRVALLDIGSCLLLLLLSSK